MQPTSPDPLSALPLTPAAFHILLVLAPGERHGYAIMQEVAALSQGVIKLGPGTLYGTLKRMIAEDLIEEKDERPDPAIDDARRRYYGLTSFGQRVMQAEAERYAQLVRHAQQHRGPQLAASQGVAGALAGALGAGRLA